jgi:hypothetical protein
MALWMQEIKPLFNSMKNLLVVFEFALYLLALKTKLKDNIEFISYLPALIFHDVSGNTTIF